MTGQDDEDPGIATRIRNAWLGRISGCMLGKPVKILSMREGPLSRTRRAAREAARRGVTDDRELGAAAGQSTPA